MRKHTTRQQPTIIKESVDNIWPQTGVRHGLVPDSTIIIALCVLSLALALVSITIATWRV